MLGERACACTQQSPHNTAEPSPHNTAEPLKAAKLLCAIANASQPKSSKMSAMLGERACACTQQSPHNTAEPLKAVKLLCVFLNAGAFRCACAVTRVNEALLAAVVITWNRCSAGKCQQFVTASGGTPIRARHGMLMSASHVYPKRRHVHPSCSPCGPPCLPFRAHRLLGGAIQLAGPASGPANATRTRALSNS